MSQLDRRRLTLSVGLSLLILFTSPPAEGHEPDAAPSTQRAEATQTAPSTQSAPATQPDDAEEEAEPSEPSVLILAGEVHVGDGTVYAPGQVLLAGGEIRAVGEDVDAPDDADLLDLSHAVLTPGLTDPSVGVSAGSGETGGLSAATLTAADARSAWDPWLEPLREGGVEAACLTPVGSGLLRGRAATVGTAGPGVSGAPLLSSDVALIAAYGGAGGSASRASRRAKLGRMLEGAEKYRKSWDEWRKHEKEMEELSPRERRRRAKEKKKPPKKPGHSAGNEILLEVLDKSLPLRIEANRVEDVRAALDLARTRKLPIAISGCLECGRAAEELAESRAIVLLRPLLAPTLEGQRGEPDAELVRTLAEADVRLAVTGGGPWPSGPQWLRTAAGALVGAGCDRATAVAAMTGNAAELAGIGDSHGLLAEGRSGVFLAWSGDPLDPSSKLLRRMDPAELAPAETGDEEDSSDDAPDDDMETRS